MTTDGLVFEWTKEAPNPRPTRGRGAGAEWERPALMLQEHRGEWAVIYRGDHKAALNIASRIRSGRIRAFAPHGSYESSEQDGAVFARFVGAPVEATAEVPGPNG